MKGPVGFVGLGNMGGRMARRLTGSGHHVLGFDLSRDAADRAGVPLAQSVRDLTVRSGPILLSLPDSRAVEDTVVGEGGILDSARKGQVVVDLSTSAPASTQSLHARLAEVGVEFLDAGVSGGATAAENGSLTLMVGGAEEALNSMEPVLTGLASSIHWMGASGTGHSMKLINNFLNAVNLSASSEAMLAAKRAGLDIRQALEVINTSSGENWATQNRFPNIIRGDYLEGGLTSDLMMKDLQLYLEHLVDLGLPSLNSPGPVSMFGLAIHRGYGDEISNRVVDALGDLIGGARLHNNES